MAYTEISNQEIIITLPVEKVYPEIKEKLEEYLNHFPIKVIPVKKLSQAQNGLIHVLLKQFGDEIGYTLIEIKELMKEQFAISTDRLDFSTAKCDMEAANEFISFIIEQALELGINLYILGKHDKRYKHILEIDNITQRYVIACLRKRVCCVCGRTHNEYNTVDLEHYDNVNEIGGYEFDTGLETRFLSLCRHHHTEIHNIPKQEFLEKYHLEPVYLNERLVYELLEVYPNHFKLFRKRLKEGYYRGSIKEK